jgi:hypothetical protein
VLSLNHRKRDDITIVETRAVTGGVDTHAVAHVAAALDPIGGLLGVQEFPATAAGYAGLLGWLAGSGGSALVGIEGTARYGAGLARHMPAGRSVWEDAWEVFTSSSPSPPRSVAALDDQQRSSLSYQLRKIQSRGHFPKGGGHPPCCPALLSRGLPRSQISHCLADVMASTFPPCRAMKSTTASPRP